MILVPRALTSFHTSDCALVSAFTLIPPPHAQDRPRKQHKTEDDRGARDGGFVGHILGNRGYWRIRQELIILDVGGHSSLLVVALLMARGAEPHHVERLAVVLVVRLRFGIPTGAWLGDQFP